MTSKRVGLKEGEAARFLFCFFFLSGGPLPATHRHGGQWRPRKCRQRKKNKTKKEEEEEEEEEDEKRNETNRLWGGKGKKRPKKKRRRAAG